MKMGCREWFIAIILIAAVLGVAGPIAPGSGQSRREGGLRSALRGRWEELIRSVEAKQEAGCDVSPVVPYLKEIRGAARHGEAGVAAGRIEDASAILAALPAPAPLPGGPAEVRVDASSPGEPIPRLAGNVVVQDLDDDPRFERFMREIGPGLVQVKLFLSDLDEDHSNYQYLRNPGKWEEKIARINAAGGEVMLHLRNVPARLTKVPAANKKPYDGKAPLAGPEAYDEWRRIVREVVGHFNRKPGTRISYVQDIGEPNIGTNWYDLRDPLKQKGRPANAGEFALHFLNTIEGAREADPEIRVGGPTLWFTTNDRVWWDGFLGTLSRHGAPLGFVSVHIYEPNFGIWDRGVAIAREKMRRYGYGDLPLAMTEWSVILGGQEAAKNLKNTHVNASHAVAGLLRIMESGMTHTFFYLGPGSVSRKYRPGIEGYAQNALLFIRNGRVVPNTGYNAFRLFAMLHEAVRLPLRSNDPRIVAIAGRKDGEVLLLLAHYEPLARDFSKATFPFREPDWNARCTVRVRIDNLPFARYAVETYRIDREHANVHTLGPRGAELEEPVRMRGRGRTFEQEIEVPSYGVFLLRLVPDRA